MFCVSPSPSGVVCVRLPMVACIRLHGFALYCCSVVLVSVVLVGTGAYSFVARLILIRLIIGRGVGF